MEPAMTRILMSFLALTTIASGFNKAAVTQPKGAESTETKYLSFQLMTGLPGYAGPQPMPGHFALSKAQLEDFVQDAVKAIKTTGDTRHKLGFTVGPLCFDMSDEETRQFIRDAFAVARENDVAVAVHIDDSLSWGQRKDLMSNPDNIEIAGWNQKPSTGRRADWGPKPTRFPPQMCFNSPDVQAAVRKRASLIGAEVKKEIDALKTSGQHHLFCRHHCRMGDIYRPRFRNGPSPGLSRPRPSRIQQDQSAQGPRLGTGQDRQGIHGALGQLSAHGRNSPSEDILPHRFHGPGTARSRRQGILCDEGSIRPARGGLQLCLPCRIFHLSRGLDFQGDLCRPGPAWFSRLDLWRGHQCVPHRIARRAHHGNLSGADV